MLLLPFLFPFHGFSYNHPELHWRSVTSDHFVVHFYDNTEPLVSQAVGIAEEAYMPLTALYGFTTSEKIDIVLADYDDISNGFADWLGGAVWIWVPDGSFPFRGRAPWLRNVITHELSHIFSLRKQPGMQMLYSGAAIGIHRPGFTLTVGKIFPMMQLFPMWFAEGLAQRGSAFRGNDCWDNRRDMILRCALVDHKDLSLDQMEAFTHDQLGNEMVYNQGFSLTTFIANAIGNDELHAVLRRAGAQTFDPFMVANPSPLSTLDGRSLETYYRSWRDSALIAARRKLPVQATQAECVWLKGNLNRVPRTGPRGLVWGCLTSNDDDSYRTDLVIVPGGSDVPVRVIRRAELSWDFAPKTGFVYFIKSYDPGEHGSFFNELYRCHLPTGKIERLTRNGRMYAVAVSPTEKEVAVVRFRNARFSLETFDLSSMTFHVVDEGAPGNPFVSIDYDPGDSSRIVVERIVDGRSSLYLVDRGSGSARRLTGGAAQEETPSWAGNGRIYFSADYDGIFNCYSIQADGTGLARHTSVAGGAFEPVLEMGDTTLLFSEYTSSGYRIARAASVSTPYTIPEAAGCVFPASAVYKQTFPERPYSIRMSRAWWQSVASMDFFSTDSVSEFITDIGCMRSQNDALGKFGYSLGLRARGGIANAIVDSSPAICALHPTIAGANDGPARLSERLDSIARAFSGRKANPLKQGLFHRSTFETGGLRQGTARRSTGITDASLLPQFGIQSHHLGCSFQCMAMADLLIGFIPRMVLSQSLIEWQAGRSTYIGTAPVVGRILLDKLFNDDTVRYAPLVFSMPLRFDWQKVGYYNEDLQHNGNGLSMLRLEFASFNIPGKRDGDRYLPRQVDGFSGSMDFFHGFPVTKYTGFPVAVSCTVNYYTTPVNRTFFTVFPFNHGNSDLFVTTQITGALAFPVIRDAGKVGGCYYDALYAKIGYTCTAVADRAFLSMVQDAGSRRLSIIGQAFVNDQADSGAYVSHLIFVSAEANSVCSYIFSGGIEIIGIFDILKKRMGLGISALF